MESTNGSKSITIWASFCRCAQTQLSAGIWPFSLWTAAVSNHQSKIEPSGGMQVAAWRTAPAWNRLPVAIELLLPGVSGYDEWYIFQNQAPPLGSVCHANVFTSEIGPGNVFQFVNFMGWRFSDSQMKAISDLFWLQMDWVKPESYVADGGVCLLFATRNSGLSLAVRDTLNKQPSKHSDPE